MHDLDAAIARYSPLFGPFHRIDGSVQGCDFRGRIADVELDIAFGRSGALEIELIQWRSGEAPCRIHAPGPRGHAPSALPRRGCRRLDRQGPRHRLSTDLVQAVQPGDHVCLSRADRRPAADRVPADAMIAARRAASSDATMPERGRAA
ncbi:MAG: hypothetical protein IPF74_11410 [Rhodocyclaceae bacterium]|nr:hypothetical protein [Rhodocyclaceae bacterium]